MARYGQRPENALKRANEFIDVGKPACALDTLYEVFRNKKWAYNNMNEGILEPIMFKYLDLCVELRKSHIAKEGLFQYRNLFQSLNVASLENVIRGYLRTAEERTEAAREQSHQAVVDVDDLEMLATPESILLSAVCGEDAQDRSDRTILTPWVKFLWESYCQCLELLRTNAHVENLYHDIAHMAFSFCLKYNRKAEFRKLCEKLRKHLEDINKLPPLTSNVNINKVETQQLNLDTRLIQLDSAIHMELWQEAYKAIEDIHNLMNISKKQPVPKTMANYYQKLALVFWKANNCLFHAAALFRLFQLYKEMKKNFSSEELQRMACLVLLSTLAIPLPSAHPEFDRFVETDKSPQEKAQRLATLLGLPQPPTRASLLKDIVKMNVVNLAAPHLQDLYNWLEMDFDPLNLCSRVQSIIDIINKDEHSQLQQYVAALKDVTLVRLIRQVAQVYQTIEQSRLLELACFTTSLHMERLLVDCVRHNDMQIRINHGAQCIHFGMDLAESQREDRPEGPTLQSMPSEQVRNQLMNMSKVLTNAMSVINPNKKKKDRDILRHQMVQLYHDTKAREHSLILQRHKIIEDRKEYLERLNNEREEEAARRQDELARQQALQEQKRLAQEQEERERKRHENEIQQIKDRHLKEKMQQISQTSRGQKILKKLDEEVIKNMDAETITAREMEELQKERREMQQKLKSQEKKLDYFERAKRLEEIPLLQKSFEEKQIADRQFWEQQEKERIAGLIAEREIAVQHRERLKRMKGDKDAFLNQLAKERMSAYQEKLEAFQTRLDEERKVRLAKRKKERKEERIRAHQRKKEEQARKVKEEFERKEREEMEERKRKEKEEEEERQRKLKEKQQREEEERKKKEQAERQARQEAEEEKSNWRRGGDAPARDSGRDSVRDSDKDRDRDRERDRPREPEASSWRSGGARPEPSKEAWKPRMLRGDTEGKSDWRSAKEIDSDRPRDRFAESDNFRGDRDRDRGGDRGGDRDRERGDRFGDRDRDRGDRLGDRDRSDRFGDRDRERGDRFGDRDRDRFGDRDRDRFGDRDRDRGERFGDRDRSDRFGDRDRDRGERFGDRFSRGDRDGDRFSRGEREGGRFQGSWRNAAAAGGEDDDDRRGRGGDDRDDDRRRDDRRDDDRRRDDRRDDDRRRDDRRDDDRRRDDRRDDDRRRDDRRDNRRDDRRDDDRKDEPRGPPEKQAWRRDGPPKDPPARKPAEKSTEEDGWSKVARR